MCGKLRRRNRLIIRCANGDFTNKHSNYCQCELLPSLGVRRLSSVICSHFNILPICLFSGWFTIMLFFSIHVSSSSSLEWSDISTYLSSLIYVSKLISLGQSIFKCPEWLRVFHAQVFEHWYRNVSLCRHSWSALLLFIIPFSLLFYLGYEILSVFLITCLSVVSPFVSLSSAFSLSLNNSSISHPSSVRGLCICVFIRWQRDMLCSFLFRRGMV